MLAWGLVILAVLAGVTKGYFGKRTSGVAEQFHDAVYVNILRFFLCALLGGIISMVQSGPAVFANLDGWWLALICGLGQAAFATTWLLSVRTGAYIMLDAFLTAGILIPTLLCRFLYQEPIYGQQWLGFAILLCAVCLMCSYNNSIKKKLTPKGIALLIACGASSGMADFTQKAVNYHYPQMSIASFQFYSYVFATLILAIVYLFIKPRKEKPVSVRKVGWMLAIMAVCLFMNSFCKQFAATRISAVALYSATQGGGLILSMIMAAVLLHEPPKKRSIIAAVLIFVAMLLIVFAG